MKTNDKKESLLESVMYLLVLSSGASFYNVLFMRITVGLFYLIRLVSLGLVDKMGLRSGPHHFPPKPRVGVNFF